MHPFSKYGSLRSAPRCPTGKSIAWRRARRLETSQYRSRVKRNFSSPFKLIWVVQSCAKKYFASRYPQISGFIALSRLVEEGRTRRHERGGGMRWTRARRQTTGARADGEVVWSWRSNAGAKVVKTLTRLTGDGGNQAMVTGESAKEAVKTIAQGRPGIFG